MNKAYKLEKLIWLVCIITFPAASFAQVIDNTHSEISSHAIEEIIKKMTLEEKIAMCSGAMPDMAFKGVERLGIPNVQCTDGPRGPSRGGTGTVFPSGLSFGASWNPALIKQVGQVMGNETRSKGLGVLLGPSNNILRDPLNGRFFEYYTEDPFLNSRITVAAVTGIQSEGVAACLKHYACNNREDNRNFYMSMVDERTLHEIYLPAYKAAVTEGNVWTIMTAANGVNSEFVSDSKKLLSDILKKSWGFDGFVLTDWLQTRSTNKAALAGLDVSMPGGQDCGFGLPLLEAVQKGAISIEVIEDKVRRILTIYNRIGILSNRDLKKGAAVNTKAHQLIARKVAEEGIVLLKNDNDVLPFDADKIKNVLIIGPNADKQLCVPGMGGSSGMRPPYEVTPLKGISNLIGAEKITYIPSSVLGGFQLIPSESISNPSGGKGFGASYFVNGNDKAVLERKDAVLDFMWEMKSPDEKIASKEFRGAIFRGNLIPPMDGKYTLKLLVNGIATIYHGGTDGEQIAFGDSRQELREATASISLKKNVPYEISIKYEKLPGDAAIRLEWELPEVPSSQCEAVDNAVKMADAVIYIGGTDHSVDTEGRDRKSMSFSGAQENIINRLSRLNKKVVTVLINGAPMELGSWLGNIPAVVEAWYPGMECGTAIADVLFGKVNPSGKLPFSWPKTLDKAPSVVLGSQNNDEVYYTDSLMVGYRYYDSKKVIPEFPFGFGLSYTTYKYGRMKLQRINGKISAKINIVNSGAKDGMEVVQLYVKPLHPSIDRPLHELKGFQKVALKKGESNVLEFLLDESAFSYYDVKTGSWKMDPGQYQIEIGASSRDIRSAKQIKVHSAISK